MVILQYLKMRLEALEKLYSSLEDDTPAHAHEKNRAWGQMTEVTEAIKFIETGENDFVKK